MVRRVVMGFLFCVCWSKCFNIDRVLFFEFLLICNLIGCLILSVLLMMVLLVFLFIGIGLSVNIVLFIVLELFRMVLLSGIVLLVWIKMWLFGIRLFVGIWDWWFCLFSICVVSICEWFRWILVFCEWCCVCIFRWWFIERKNMNM